MICEVLPKMDQLSKSCMHLDYCDVVTKKIVPERCLPETKREADINCCSVRKAVLQFRLLWKLCLWQRRKSREPGWSISLKVPHFPAL